MIRRKVPKNSNMTKNYIIFILLLISILIHKSIISSYISKKIKLRICFINLLNLQNVGNISVEFSLYKQLKEFGFNATIVASVSSPKVNISFLNRTTIIKNK